MMVGFLHGSSPATEPKEEEAHQNQPNDQEMTAAAVVAAKSSVTPKPSFKMIPSALTPTRSSSSKMMDRSSQIPRLQTSSSSAPRPPRLSFFASPPPPSQLLTSPPPPTVLPSCTPGGTAATIVEKNMSTSPTPATSTVAAVSTNRAISRIQEPVTTTTTTTANNNHNNTAAASRSSAILSSSSTSLPFKEYETDLMMTPTTSHRNHDNKGLSVNTTTTGSDSIFRNTTSTVVRRTSFLSPAFDHSNGGAAGTGIIGKSQVRVVARIRPLLPSEQRAYYNMMSIHPYHEHHHHRRHHNQADEDDDEEEDDDEYASQLSNISPAVSTTELEFAAAAAPSLSPSKSSPTAASTTTNASEVENRGFGNAQPNDTDNTASPSSSPRAALGALPEKSNSANSTIPNSAPIPSDATSATVDPSTTLSSRSSSSNRCSSPNNTSSRRSLLCPPSPTRRNSVVRMTSNSNNNNTDNIAAATATCKTPTCKNSGGSGGQDNSNNAVMPRSLIATTSACQLSTSTMAAVDRRFDFDVVFPTTCTQEQVYQHAVGDAIRRNIVRGYNTTILAYGQTGSGKTYTMGGSTASALCNNTTATTTPRTATTTASIPDGLKDDDGIIPRAIADLFEARNDYRHMGKVSIELTCLEIYNDELRDLLVDNQGLSLKLRDHGDQDGVEVRGLQSVQLTSVQQALEYMHHATLRRTTAVTAMNERSSRSHSICTLSVSIQPHHRKIASAPALIRAKLTLVDLAGSERLKETGVMGLQQQESININKDLFVLGKVVATLSEKSKRDQALATNPTDERFNARKEPRHFHVPYRDCKLTRLLRDSLGGNCCTVLVACVSPAEVHVEESLNTLRYAARSRSITNSIRKNVISSAPSDEVSKLRAENKKYKVLLSQLKRRLLVLQMQVRTPSPQHRKINISPNAALCAELSGLQSKLELAEEEARAAKEQSQSVMVTADRWKQQLEQMKRGSLKEDPTSEVALPFEMANNEDSTTDEESCTSVSSLKLSTDAVHGEETEGGNLVVGDDVDQVDAAEVQAEIERLVDQKFDLADQLADLRDLIESKRVDLEEMEDEFSSRQSELLAVIARQEQERDQLGKQLAQMKLQLHLLASNLKERASSTNNKDVHRSHGGGKFSAIFRTLSADAAFEMNEEKGSEVEMQTLRENNDSFNAKLEALLQEERAKCLQKQHENEELLQRIAMLQAENKLLLEQKEKQPPASVELESSRHSVLEHDETLGTGELEGHTTDRRDETPLEESDRNSSQRAADVRVATTNRRNSTISMCSSYASSEGTELRPSAMECGDDGHVLISNLDLLERVPGCMCTRAPSAFSTNPEHVEFYLPKLRLTCSYCRPKDNSAPPSDKQEEDLGEDPLALSNILREWQVQFLNSMGIDHAMALVQANSRQSGVLAKHMRRWRRKHQLQSIKTKSCWLALHIWARTCQTIVTAIQTRRAGMVKGTSKQLLPSFLEVPIDSSDDRSVSTLGGDVSIRCYLVKDRDS